MSTHAVRKEGAALHGIDLSQTLLFSEEKMKIIKRRLGALLDVALLSIQDSRPSEDQDAIVGPAKRAGHDLTLFHNQQQQSVQEKALHLLIGLKIRQLAELFPDVRNMHPMIEKIEIFQITRDPITQSVFRSEAV